MDRVGKKRHKQKHKHATNNVIRQAHTHAHAGLTGHACSINDDTHEHLEDAPGRPKYFGGQNCAAGGCVNSSGEMFAVVVIL